MAHRPSTGSWITFVAVAIVGLIFALLLLTGEDSEQPRPTPATPEAMGIEEGAPPLDANHINSVIDPLDDQTED